MTSRNTLTAPVHPYPEESAPVRRTPRRRPRRKPGQGVGWMILSLWLLGFGALAVSSLMIGEGYRIDAMESQLTALTRTEQLTAGQVAVALSPTALAHDAAEDHVKVLPLMTALPRAASPGEHHSSMAPGGLGGHLKAWLADLRLLETGIREARH